MPDRVPIPWEQLRRWRPLVVAVAAVVALAVFPASGKDDSSTQAATEGKTTVAGDVNGLTARDPGADDVVAPAGGTDTASGRSSPNSVTAVAPLRSGSDIGVGSAEALSGPNCDPATGRIRIPLRYAPPCVQPWPSGADNGGMTATGVSKSTIKLVLYNPPPTSGVRTQAEQQQSFRDWEAYVDIFNDHYEFWGRRIEVIYVEGSGRDEVSLRADAVRVATDIKPFLVTVNAGAAVEIFSAEMAARGAVVINQNAPWASTQKQAPFRWASTADERTVITHFAEYAGKRLTGKPARWAGDLAFQNRERKFGLVYPDDWDKKFIDQTLAANGVPLASAMSYKAGDVPGAQERARTLIARMKADGVTSIIDGADYLFNVVLTKEATAQLFQPEWVMTGWAYQDIVLFARLFDQQQWSHAFGPGPVMVLVPAANYETSGWEEGSIWHWHYQGSRAPETQGNVGSAASVLPPFAACVHLAGPVLTPETFRDGCFAYPPTGGTHCGCIMTTGFSFGRRPGVPWLSYTAWDDMAEKWWDPNANGGDEAGITPAGGYYRRVDGGRRYAVGGWPAGEPRVFDPEGTVTFMDQYPPNERPPQYEHRPH